MSNFKNLNKIIYAILIFVLCYLVFFAVNQKLQKKVENQVQTDVSEVVNLSNGNQKFKSDAYGFEFVFSEGFNKTGSYGVETSMNNIVTLKSNDFRSFGTSLDAIFSVSVSYNDKEYCEKTPDSPYLTDIKKVNINGNEFLTYKTSGSSESRTVTDTFYNHLSKNTCFEIATRISKESGTGRTDTSDIPVEEQQKKLESEIEKILDSFKFVGDKTEVIGVNPNDCCPCPQIILKSQIGKEGWILYEEGQKYKTESNSCSFSICSCPNTKDLIKNIEANK